ncbi:heavy metal translocating P-type ATPase [Ktedonospora formicarum]|uniref:Cobalt ABC transporter ATP-binding protein n=1 Tax=Ktedonospora formicarum TaxID=2778364 RepID=A0A8J3IAY2_9CHLR|nr:heavy metal translocating P-type ATPase [Ktedonospora formicarum]GHO48709.1 cobalt ABC transporter ATP-binding protein [Ktedonospora formicarum]
MQAAQRYPLPVGAAILMVISLLFWLIGHVSLANWGFLLVILAGALRLFWQTIRHVLHKEFSVDVIALLAIIGSFLLGQYLAGAVIVLMFSGGEALEAFAVRRARASLAALAQRVPQTAHIWQGEELVSIPADQVEVGMEVVLKPGELAPVDGVVTAGTSSMSEADLTGEPFPVRKAPGMLVLSGSVNLDTILEIRAQKRSTESKYAQIVHLVEEAQHQKAPIHRLADRYSIGFTALAIGLAGLAWVFSGDALYALAVLVVATPCPLILATPIAIMSGIDRAARNGIITKSGASIEQLGEVDIAVFDKTGTLTLGMPKVTAIVRVQPETQYTEALEKTTSTRCAQHALYDEETLLRLAASIEQLSTHILARAVVELAQERGIPLCEADGFEEIFGKGVRGWVPLHRQEEQGTQGKGGQKHEKIEVAVGNRTFMKYLSIAIPPSFLEERQRRVNSGQICSFLAISKQIEGLLVLEDVPRPEISRLSADLHTAGVKETILLTGDNEVVAQKIGKLAHVDRVVARCLPEDKVRIIEELVAQKHGVLMVGDGINDAPALATATVGMALGTQGLTAAATTADTVLLSTDILRVARAVRLGRWVMHVARQGIWVGMGLSVIAMFIAAFGFIPPTVGALLQEAIDAVVILNALRAGRGSLEGRAIQPTTPSEDQKNASFEQPQTRVAHSHLSLEEGHQ